MADSKGLPANIHQLFLAQSWRDPEFRRRAVENPRAALAELGYSVPEGVTVAVVSQAPNLLVLPVVQHPAGAPTTPGAGEVGIEARWTSRDGDCGGYCTATSECTCTFVYTATGDCICRP